MSEVSKNITKNGKGDSYRIPITDKQYQKNYNKIFNKIFKKETNVPNRKY